MLPFFVYFTFNNALQDFFQEVFLDAPSAKGSLTSGLTGWVLRLPQQFNLTKNSLVYILFFFALLGLDKVWLKDLLDKKNKISTNARTLRLAYKFFIVFNASICCYFVYTNFFYGQINSYAKSYMGFGHLLLIPTRVMPVWFICYLWIKAMVNTKFRQYLIPAIFSLGMIFGTGSSGGLNWYATAIPFGIMVIYFWNEVQHSNFFEYMALLMIPIMLSTLLVDWSNNPYNWWGLRTSSTAEANVKIDHGLAKGLYTDSNSYAINLAVENDLGMATKCKGGIIAFPSIPIYVLNLGVQPKGRDAIFWFDFVTQKNVTKAINYFKKNPPDGVVLLNIPSFVWSGHSKVFNQGKEYRQSDLIKFFNALAIKGYTEKTYPLNESMGYSITTLVNSNCDKKAR